MIESEQELLRTLTQLTFNKALSDDEHEAVCIALDSMRMAQTFSDNLTKGFLEARRTNERLASLARKIFNVGQ